ncbi:hypothetical protein B7463_g3409, partial [Scytalidium lignicola]
MFETGLFINNEFVDSKSGETLTLINPFDESKIPAAVQVAVEADIDAAVAAAQAAFKTGPWSTYTGAQRAAHLFKFADLLEKNAKEIAELDSLCMGAPVAPNAGFIIPQAAACFRYYAGWADKIEGESFAADDGTYKIVRHEPLGVCAGIAPWNAPMLYVAWKIAPALAAGNTFIYKASEVTPLSALALGKLVIEAGFPPGVLQFVSGGQKTGTLLASNMTIAKISYTGSTAVGKVVQKLALDSNMKEVTLELGGKSPAIVFADADIENAVGSTADGFLFNSGQVCVAGSRLFVQDSIAPAFIEAVKSRFEAISNGLGPDPKEFTTGYGPIATEKHFNTVMKYIDIGKKGKAPLIGGTRKGDKGFFINPTIFLNPDLESPVYKEEIFGPVLSLVIFNTEDEVIELANNTVTGLSATIYTNDLNRALRVSAKIDSGNVSVNAPHFPLPQVPFGGFKESGKGKENGKYGLMEYLKTKSILINDHVADNIDDEISSGLILGNNTSQNENYNTSDVTSPSVDPEPDTEKTAIKLISPSATSSDNESSVYTLSSHDEREEDVAAAAENAANSAEDSSSNISEVTLKFAIQLYTFQGCTNEQHQQENDRHSVHHQQPGINPLCTSLADIVPVALGTTCRQHVATPPRCFERARYHKARRDLQRKLCQRI